MLECEPDKLAQNAPSQSEPWKADKLSQGAYKQTSYPRVQWENGLDKREATEPQGEKRQNKQKRNLKEGNVRSRNRSKNIGLPMLQEARNKA